MRLGRANTTFFIFALLTTAPLAALQEDPLGEARRLTRFGVEAAMKGLWDEARFRWLQVVGIYPNFPAAHNNLAVAYEHQGKYVEARLHYRLAYDMSRRNRYVESNGRMFLQFFKQHIEQLNRSEEGDTDSDGKAAAKQDGGQDFTLPRETQEDGQGEDGDPEPLVADRDREIYRRVGSSHQVLIKHPKRETELSGKYKRIYVAGFSSADENAVNLNFETTEYFRSELRKHTLYDILPLEELTMPSDEDEFFELADDIEFWQRLGDRVGADLVIYGRVNFYAEPSDGFYPYEYRDYRSGSYRTAQLLIMRTAMTIELDLFFRDTATGELVHEENFGQTIIYRGRLDPTLQAFFDVMNRILPRFIDVLVPREHDAIRFLLKG